MKTILLTTAFIIALLLVVSASFAQQNTKADDAVLLDYYQSQRYQEAVDYLKKTYPEPVTDIKILSRLAYTTQMANKLPEAQAYYQRIYDMDTTNLGALLSIGNLNLRRGNEQNAELFFKKILLQDTTNITVYTKLATIATHKKDTLYAVNYLQKANNLNVMDADVVFDLSGYYIAQKKFDQALVILNKASETDPDNIFLLLRMFELLYKQTKYAETITVGQKLMALNAADSRTIINMGISYYKLKNYACGAEVLAGISGIQQTEASCYYTAMCYKELKDYKQSINWMNNAIAQAISVNVFTYYGEIGDNNGLMAKYDQAIAAYQKALQFNEDPAVYIALGDLYANKIKNKAQAKLYYKKAAAAYQKQIQISDEPMSYYSLADLYDTQLKDTANAVKYYKKFLSSKPSAKQKQFINYTQSRINQLMVTN